MPATVKDVAKAANVSVGHGQPCAQRRAECRGSATTQRVMKAVEATRLLAVDENAKATGQWSGQLAKQEHCHVANRAWIDHLVSLPSVAGAEYMELSRLSQVPQARTCCLPICHACRRDPQNNCEPRIFTACWPREPCRES